MATLHNFSRSLEPIWEFDDDGLLGDCEAISLGNEVVPYASNGNSSGVILTAFIDHLCGLYETNPARREKLFHLICNEMRKTGFLKLINLSDSLGRQMRDGFTQLLQAARQSISQDFAMASTSSINQQSILPFISPPRNPLLSKPSVNLVVESFNYSSKLHSEFKSIKPIEGAEGAGGKVFVVTKKSDGVRYAVKKIKIKSHCGDAIQREVEILARLSHPNIVRYYDSWDGFEFVPPDSDSEDEWDSYSAPVQKKFNQQDPVLTTPTHFLYIQMELCVGTLKDWLLERNKRGINYDESYQIAKQILKAVDFIHAENYFHRDLKPLNIFLSKKSANEVPSIKIGDFGLARNMHVHDINNAGIKEVHFTADVGTPHYGAPEQLNGSVYSEKTDMFSMGLILHELYFLFGTDMEKMHVFTKLREKEEIDATLAKSRPVEALWIQRLTAKNPDTRPTAAEVLKDLRKLKSNLGASVEVLKGCIVAQSYELEDVKRQLSEKDSILCEKDRLLAEKDYRLQQQDQQISDLIAVNIADKKKISELMTLLEQAKLDGR